MKPRSPGSLRDGIFQVIAFLGDVVASVATGRSAPHLRACSDPDSDRGLMLADALELDVAAVQKGGRALIVEAYLLQLTRRTSIAGVGEAGLSPVERIALLTESLGRISTTLREALQDGHVSAAERHALDAAVTNHEKWLADLRQTLPGVGKAKAVR